MIEAVLPPLQRWLLFSGTLLLVGAVSWRSFVAPWQPPALRAHMRRVEEDLTRTGRLVALLLIPVWGVRLWVQVIDFRDPFVPLAEDLRFLLLDTVWGTVWIGQGVVIVGMAAIFGVLVREVRGRRTEKEQGREAGTLQPEEVGPAPRLGPAWKAAWAGALLLVLTLSLSSHAMSVPLVAPLAVAMDGLHALGAGAWMGTLALILHLRPKGPEAVPILAGQLRSFSYLALGAVPLLVVMGIGLSGFHLGEARSLWTSWYGRVLGLKIAVAGGVLLLGLLNWRTGLPVVDRPEGARAVRRRATLEVGLAAVVVLLTAVLVGLPMPEGVH